MVGPPPSSHPLDNNDWQIICVLLLPVSLDLVWFLQTPKESILKNLVQGRVSSKEQKIFVIKHNLNLDFNFIGLTPNRKFLHFCKIGDRFRTFICAWDIILLFIVKQLNTLLINLYTNLLLPSKEHVTQFPL